MQVCNRVWRQRNSVDLGLVSAVMHKCTRDLFSGWLVQRNLANQLRKSFMSNGNVRPLLATAGSAGATPPGAGPTSAAARAAPQADLVSSSLTVGFALIGALGVALLAYLASRAAQPLVLTILAGFATVGVFFLFALAARYIRFGQTASEGDLLQRLLDTDAGGIAVTDPTGSRMLAHNASFLQISGSNGIGDTNTPETLLSSTPTGAEALFRLLRSAERGYPAAERLLLPSLDGKSDRWIKVSVRRMDLVPASGGMPALVWRLDDLTADMQAQNAERAAIENRLTRLSAAPVGLLSVDADGHVRDVNDRLAAWLGYANPARLQDTRLSDLIADGGAQLLMSLAAASSADGVRRFDLDLVGENGRRWPATLLSLNDAERLSIAVLERITDDDTAFKAAGAQPRFSRYFQSAHFGIAALDADGRILSANPAFARLLLDGGQHRGSSLIELMARVGLETTRKIESALNEARDGKANIAPLDVTISTKSGDFTRKVYISSLARAGAKGSGETAILYVIDTTEAKALEHKFAQAQKMEAVGTLAGGIAHDFNNVLTAIIGFSDLLLQTHKPGNASHQHVMAIKSSANRAAGLVRQLLAFSRRQTMQPRVLQMGDLLTDWSLLVNRLLGEKIELKLQSGRDLWHVKADPSELERIIINLAVNARDAMLPKGGRLVIRTRNITERDSQKLAHQGVARGEYVAIEVEDNGCGMTPEIMAKIFDPFFTTKAVGKGTGLGLASVYGIVQQTGGYIIPESAPGVGTTFRIYLPRHEIEATDEVEPPPSAKKPRPRDLSGTGRVLLVEDEEAVRRFAVTALKSKGYEVLQANDGVEALEIFKEHDNKVDIVVSDVMMPEMDGPTLMSEMRKIDPHLKFIFVSGYPDDAFKHNLDPEADFTFLPKPYNLAQLAAQVKEQLEA